MEIPMNRGKKTILITISRGGTARNILQTRIFKHLLEMNIQIVIVTPAYNDQKFVETFAHPNVIFEPLFELPWRPLDRYFVGLHKALVYNYSTEFRDKFGIYNPEEGSLLKYYLRRFFIRPFAQLPKLHNLARRLDDVVCPARAYHHIFEKYKPDAVFATSVVEDMDIEVMKTAREYKVKIIGMAKSWDNLSKINMRVVPDILLTWGPYSQREAQEFSNVEESTIVNVGIPQWDFYHDPMYTLTREQFCAMNNLDPQKKIIVFGSEGKITPGDGPIAKFIAQKIQAGELENAQLYVRPHFMHVGDEKKFEGLQGVSGVVVDTSYKHNTVFKDNWDYSYTQIAHFTNLMKHADVLVTTASSLTLDAAANDCPIINIHFDGDGYQDKQHSITRWYTTEHYRNVLQTNAVSLVEDGVSLCSAIQVYLREPTIKQVERKNLTEYFGFHNDGKTAERVCDQLRIMLQL